MSAPAEAAGQLLSEDHTVIITSHLPKRIGVISPRVTRYTSFAISFLNPMPDVLTDWLRVADVEQHVRRSGTMSCVDTLIWFDRLDCANLRLMCVIRHSIHHGGSALPVANPSVAIAALTDGSVAVLTNHPDGPRPPLHRPEADKVTLLTALLPLLLVQRDMS